MDGQIARLLHKRRKRRLLLCRIYLLLFKCQIERIYLLCLLHQIYARHTNVLTDRSSWGGRAVGSKNLKRRKISTWIYDYLGPSPVYPSNLFRRRFAIPRTLFYKLKNDLIAHNPSYWPQRRRGFGPLGHTAEQRVLSALRILSTGCSYDILDDVSLMSEEAVREAFQCFCNDVIEIYGDKFLNRRPTKEELKHISSSYTTVGFPGCIGSVDCMKLYWKNCPYYEKGQLLNTKESTSLATVVCEGWSDHDLYCWNWFPGRPGTNNDITVLHCSPLFRDIFNNIFNINSNDVYYIPPSKNPRTMYYFLVDGIYRSWLFQRL